MKPLFEKEINLENPIFVFYINVQGLSRQQAEELITQYQSGFGSITNIESWFFASNQTKVECIWTGKSSMGNTSLLGFIKEINKRVDILSKSPSAEEFKMNLRDWKIDSVLPEDEL